MGFYKHDNEPAGSIKAWNVLPSK